MVQSELPGLTAQVAKGQVKLAWIFIGGNDLGYFVDDVASGKIAPDQVQTQLTQVATQLDKNFLTAVNTLLAANPKVRLVVSTLPDITLQPLIASEFAAAGPQGQALAAAVSAATQQYNQLIISTANSNPRIALDDLAGLSQNLIQQAGSTGTLPYGGTTISLTTPGDNYHDFFLADGIHVGTVVQGVIADSFINAVDSKFGLKVPPLSPQSIVRFAAHVRPSTP